MNRKQLTLLVVLGLIIGAAGLVLSKRESASWNRNEAGLGKKLLGDFPVNDVAQVVVKTANAELNLVKGDIWTVKERHGYPANFSEVGDLIRKAAELKAVQIVKAGPSQLGRLELVAPEPGKGTNAGTLIDFKGKDGKTIKSLLLGKKYVRESRNESPMGGGGFPAGRYVMVPGNQQSVSLVSEAMAETEPNPERWLNKEWLKVEKLKAIAITAPVATNSWKAGRETESGAWALLDKKEGEPVDTNKLSSVGYALSSPSFNDILAPDTKPEAIGMDKPLVATLETFENFIYTIRVGGKTNEDTYPVTVSVSANLPKERAAGKDEKPEDKEKLDKEFKEKLKKQEDKLKLEQGFAKWTYLVSKWTIDPLLKERKDFYIEKKEEPKPGAAAPGDAPLSIPGLPGNLLENK